MRYRVTYIQKNWVRHSRSSFARCTYSTSSKASAERVAAKLEAKGHKILTIKPEPEASK